MHFPLRILDADDEHVFRQPSFAARLPAGDAQGMALLAEERIAAVPRAETLDRQLLRKVHDEAAVGIQVADGVHALDERAVARDAFECGLAHARHQFSC